MEALLEALEVESRAVRWAGLRQEAELIEDDPDLHGTTLDFTTRNVSDFLPKGVFYGE